MADEDVEKKGVKDDARGGSGQNKLDEGEGRTRWEVKNPAGCGERM